MVIMYKLLVVVVILELKNSFQQSLIDCILFKKTESISLQRINHWKYTFKKVMY